MENIIIKIGEIITIEDNEYTVIAYKNNLIVMVDKNSTSINFLTERYDVLIEKIMLGEYIKKPSQPLPYYDKSKWNEDMKQLYNNKVQLINDITSLFGPTFIEIKTNKNKVIFDSCEEKYHMSKKSAWEVIRKYLQTGLDVNALCCQKGYKGKNKVYKKKPGQKVDGIEGKVVDDEVINNFNKAIKIYLSGRATTKKDAFELMLLENYTTIKEKDGCISRLLVSTNERPTFRQFRYYCNKIVDSEEEHIAKTSKQEQRNNERLLLSDVTLDADGPMSIVEIDECETDVTLVSDDDHSIVIGRPIVYTMIDVYSRCIVAVSASYENNSIRGVTNCLLNLIDDKVKLCKEYGLNISSNIWPSHVLPHRLRSDYGSEYISYELERICNELNIQKENVSPGTGSLKGLVEQSFHQFHSVNNWLFENNGLIEKRHDSKHKETASMTLKDFKELLYLTVTSHNSKYMKEYPLTRDMRKKKVKPIPYEIWQYGVNKYGMPRVITNEDNFRFTLLEDVKASISKDGVTFKGLKYINFDDEELFKQMINAGNKRIPINCRIDSRCVNNLYYAADGKIHTLYLNINKTGMTDYIKTSLPEYEILRKEKSKQDKKGLEDNQLLNIAVKEKQQQIKERLNNSRVETTTKNLRENRKIAKEEDQLNNLIMPIQDNNQEQVGDDKEHQFSDLIAMLEEMDEYGK